MSQVIKGFIENIIFRNEENGYTVFTLSEKSGSIHTCVGIMDVINTGENMEITGNVKEHPVYGRQINVESYKMVDPEGIDAVERYLGSGAIKGVGPKLAARIVLEFGEDTLSIIKNEPERLAEVKGISESGARKIGEQLALAEDTREAIVFLQEYGISLSTGLKIYDAYGSSMYSILRENPYLLADEMKGIGFKSADDIALKMGISPDNEYRIKSALIYILSQVTQEGGVFLPVDELIRRGAELTGADDDALRKAVEDLAAGRKVILRRTRVYGEADDSTEAVYLSKYYYTELSVARLLTDLNIICEEDDARIGRIIEKIQKKEGIALEDRQREAVEAAVRYGLFILTGGPGTGKTTTINVIIRYFLSRGMSVKLAAPTGRAAKRMAETCSYEASTIHRLLEIGAIPEGEGGVERYVYGKNADDPIDADVIIIDEMSMVDIFLMEALLKAVPSGTRLVLVGDEDQLPSVGPGSVLADMISSGAFHTVRLDRIFRQSSKSDIIVNAHRINKGENIKLDNKSSDFFFLERSDPNVIMGNILELVTKKLPPYVEADPMDIQVLSPMRKGKLGVERINAVMQQYMNPPGPDKREKETEKGIFREGDKVMQIKNDYELVWEVFGRHGIVVESGTGVFNGDIGIIREIDEFSELLTVEFDEGRTVDYGFDLLDELELSYCTTIHKAQGSEYPAVIIPVLSGPEQLLTRNLLYTAVTRARKCVMLIGSSSVIEGMIRNNERQLRYTSLSERIEELALL